MDLRAALALAKAAVAQGRLDFTYHAAEEKLPELGLTRADVESALLVADDGIVDDEVGAKWKLYGRSVSDELISVVVRFRADESALVVTVHPFP